MSVQGRKYRATHCDHCRKPLGRSRVFKDGLWLCPTCVYREEVGEPSPAPKRESAPKGDRLFEP